MRYCMAESPFRLDWSWLRDFGVVAEEGSLSLAAGRLGVSQSTLTRRMAALEDVFLKLTGRDLRE